MDYKMLYFSICQSVYELNLCDKKNITVTYLENFYSGLTNKYSKLPSEVLQFDRIQINFSPVVGITENKEFRLVHDFHNLFSLSLIEIFPDILRHTAVLFYKVGENIYPLLLRYKK